MALGKEQVVEITRERDLVPASCATMEHKRHQLLLLTGIGEGSAPDLAGEVIYRLGVFTYPVQKCVDREFKSRKI